MIKNFKFVLSRCSKVDKEKERLFNIYKNIKIEEEIKFNKNNFDVFLKETSPTKEKIENLLDSQIIIPKNRQEGGSKLKNNTKSNIYLNNGILFINRSFISEKSNEEFILFKENDTSGNSIGIIYNKVCIIIFICFILKSIYEFYREKLKIKRIIITYSLFSIIFISLSAINRSFLKMTIKEMLLIPSTNKIRLIPIKGKESLIDIDRLVYLNSRRSKFFEVGVLNDYSKNTIKKYMFSKDAYVNYEVILNLCYEECTKVKILH